MKKSLLCDKEELKFNMSKFYIKTNMVIDSPYEIHIKEELNNHVKEIIATESPTKFQGQILRREKERKPKAELEATKGTEKEIKEEEISELELLKKLDESSIKRSWKIILFERNLYAYLGHLTEELVEINYNIYAECLAFLILKRAISRILALKKGIESETVPGVDNWPMFKSSLEYRNILTLVRQEEEIFNQFYEKLALKVLEKGTLAQFEEDLMISGKFTVEETNRRMNLRVMREYFKRVEKGLKQLSGREYVHFSKLIDGLELDIFSVDFDFNAHYQQLRSAGEEAKGLHREKYQLFMES